MSDRDDLLNRARNNPAGLRFAELCRLAEAFGFERKRQKGSHIVYKRPGVFELMNFQDEDGRAKPYQVRRLLEVIDECEGR